MEALSRETLENMMEQAVAKATTVSFWPQGDLDPPSPDSFCILS
ncbi:hypothetical protein [Citrobacter freundii]